MADCSRAARRPESSASLRDKQYTAISPDGPFSGSPDVKQEFVYVVHTDAGQDTLAPAEFAQKYGWKNDPSKVTLPGM